MTGQATDFMVDNIIVTPVNHLPVPTNAGLDAVANQPVSFPAAKLATDPDGDALTFTVDPSSASGGTVSLTSGTVTYTPHGSGYTVLLNRVGVGSSTPGSSADGYGDAGASITLSSAGAANIHFYQNNSPTYSGGQLIGTWQPDGRAILPNSAPTAFDAAPTPGTADFTTFNNLDPNGTWTLFISDLSALNVSTLNSLRVDVTAVPEPVNAASGLFGIACLSLALLRIRRSALRA